MPDAIFIYLHGFLSSPQSAKAQQLVRFVQAQRLPVECRVPALPEEPRHALAAAENAVLEARAQCATVGLLGSSLGGFYATALAERYRLRTVLINPSVLPHLRFADFVRENSARGGAAGMVNPYTGRRFSIEQRDIDALAAMQPDSIGAPDNYWLLAQTGDEVLDYRDAVAFYAGCKQTVEAGGDHQFQGFERHLPEIVKFLRGF